MSAYMIIDCGTTNLRVTITDEAGNVLAQEKRPGGVRHTAIDGHNGRLKTMLAECIAQVLDDAGMTPDQIDRCIAYGMITSNVGLLEIPHLSAPVSADNLGAGVKTAVFPDVAPFPISFIPGVRNFCGQVTLENFKDMDMMRGEETEAIGLFELLGMQRECVLILPGSHNKFVRMDAQGRIVGCLTSISGELLDALTHHTILADAVDRLFATEQDYDAELARQGARECVASGLGRAAFAGRILSQLGGMESVRLRSYLQGAVLAQDVQALQRFVSDNRDVQFLIAGKMPLQAAFADVMKLMGLGTVMQVAPDITARMGVTGALRIAGSMMQGADKC